MRLPICKSYRATDMESISRVGSYMYTLLLFLTHYTISGIFNTCKEFSYSVRSSEVPLESPTPISPNLWRGFFFVSICKHILPYIRTLHYTKGTDTQIHANQLRPQLSTTPHATRKGMVSQDTQRSTTVGYSGNS